MQALEKTAAYWKNADGRNVICELCPHRCTIRPGKKGICRVKENINGKLIATAYGKATSICLDPVEKKPLYHFHPGSSILSLGPNSCNLKCDFCQNYHISQFEVRTSFIAPDALAREAREADNCIGVAYTYSEPLMWYEYIIDAAREVRDIGLKNVLVTNGHLEDGPFRELLPLVDGFNIDIKSMDEDFYRKVCKGKLGPVLRNVETAAASSHVEVTNLVIPGLNDSDDNFRRLAGFLAGIDPLIPLHFSRYRPSYKMEIPPTPVETLLRAKEIALEKLRFVYIGNVLLPKDHDTICPGCSTTLVERDYMGLREGVRNNVRVKDGKCLRCGAVVKIVT